VHKRLVLSFAVRIPAGEDLAEIVSGVEPEDVRYVAQELPNLMGSWERQGFTGFGVRSLRRFINRIWVDQRRYQCKRGLIQGMGLPMRKPSGSLSIGG
jgi:hypothetical protein